MTSKISSEPRIAIVSVTVVSNALPAPRLGLAWPVAREARDLAGVAAG